MTLAATAHGPVLAHQNDAFEARLPGRADALRPATNAVRSSATGRHGRRPCLTDRTSPPAQAVRGEPVQRAARPAGHRTKPGEKKRISDSPAHTGGPSWREIGRRGAVEEGRDDPRREEGERGQQPHVPFDLAFPASDRSETRRPAMGQIVDPFARLGDRDQGSAITARKTPAGTACANAGRFRRGRSPRSWRRGRGPRRPPREMGNGTKAKVQLVGGERPPAPQAAKLQLEREQSPLRSFSQIAEIYGAKPPRT
jgi:hypothetical protein